MTTANLQKPTNHVIQIGKNNTKMFDMQIQAFNMPGMSIITAAGAAPKISDFQIVGTQLGYGDLVVSVLLDENMDSWFEIYKWIKELINPDASMPVSFKNSVAEASLFILTNNKTFNTDFIVDFHQIYPVSISEIPWETTTTDDAAMTFTVTFKYRTFDIRRSNIRY